jgi:DNA-nicking Smr family endonuclease
MSDDGPVEIPIEHEIDLHAFQPRDIPGVVDAFLSAARESGLADVRLVHGRGIGVQRAAVQQVLAQHPAVVDYWDDPRAHLGATIARLRRG